MSGGDISANAIAHVRAIDGGLQASMTAVSFADAVLESVIEAAEDCPEECIFIEA